MLVAEKGGSRMEVINAVTLIVLLIQMVMQVVLLINLHKMKDD